MKISKAQYRTLTEAHGEAAHIGTMLDDLREGLGHPSDLDKIRKSMVRLHTYLNQCDIALAPAVRNGHANTNHAHNGHALNGHGHNGHGPMDHAADHQEKNVEREPNLLYD